MAADVEGVDRDSLKVSVWSGKVTLTDLKLRREAIYALGLPVSIKAGYIKHVELSIPWKQLGTDPVVLTFDGVYLVAGPLDEGTAEEDETAAAEWAWSRKRGRLQRLWQAAQLKTAALKEAVAPGSPDGKADELRRDTLSLLTKIIYNLQFCLTNIHVRYEDRHHSAAPFAVGVTLAELSAHTTDANGRRAFTADSNVHYKRAELQQLAVYHHSGCAEADLLDPAASHRQMAEWLRAMVRRGDGGPTPPPPPPHPTHQATNPPAVAPQVSGRSARAHWASAAAAVAPDGSNQIAALPALPSSHYVMQPVSAEVRATLRGESALLHGAPRTSTELRLSALGMRLSEHQLRDSVRLLEYVTSDVIGAPDAEDESWAAAADSPTAPPRPVGCAGGEARAWWRFALRRVREEVRRQKGWRLGTGFFEQRRRARLRYVELYRRAQGKPWLS